MITKSIFSVVLMGSLLTVSPWDTKADKPLPVYPSSTAACKSFKDPTSCLQSQATVAGQLDNLKVDYALVTATLGLVNEKVASGTPLGTTDMRGLNNAIKNLKITVPPLIPNRVLGERRGGPQWVSGFARSTRISLWLLHRSYFFLRACCGEKVFL